VIPIVHRQEIAGDLTEELGDLDPEAVVSAHRELIEGGQVIGYIKAHGSPLLARAKTAD
jgi:hypothetical protein